MSSPLELAKGWEEATYTFIETARARTPSQKPFSLFHIMIEALADVPPEKRTVAPLHRFMRDNQRMECSAAIRVELILHGETTMGIEGMTPATAQAFFKWSTDADRRGVKVTIPFILWHILTYDAAIRTIFDTLAVDIDRLTTSLEYLFAPLYSTINQPITVTNPGEIYQLAKAVTDEIRPSSERPGNLEQKLQYTHMHAVLMSNILNILGKLDKHQIAVVAGMNGTPLYSIDEVLADLLKDENYSVEGRPRLAKRFKKVYRLDSVSLITLANKGASPIDVLQAVLQEAENNEAILVVKNFETLLAERDHALRSLLTLSENLVLGTFETGVQDHLTTQHLSTFDDVVEILARPYSVQQTKELIRTYYLPDWEHRTNYTFATDAFDSVIALEPGAWINAKRKTLPYLAIGLGDDTIQTARGGKSLILDTVHMAIDALDGLQTEAATSSAIYRKTFQPTLDEARADFEKLVNFPMPERDTSGHYILTRAHVAAQLICPNDSEFHFPGFAPQELTSTRNRDLPK